MKSREQGAIRAALGAAVEVRPELFEAYLLGSLVSHETGATSDVDVAVYLDDSSVAQERGRRASELAAELISRVGRNDRDVILLNSAPPLLNHRVLRGGAVRRVALVDSALVGYSIEARP